MRPVRNAYESAIVSTCICFGVCGLRSGVWGLGFEVLGVGCGIDLLEIDAAGVEDPGVLDQKGLALGCLPHLFPEYLQGLGFGVQGLKRRVHGSGLGLRYCRPFGVGVEG